MSEQSDNDSPRLGSMAGVKSKPIKVLPTDRMAFDKILRVFRAYPAASGPEKVATTNADVGKIADIPASSVSMCNPFMVDCGLLIREGIKQRPTQPLFDYLAAWEWDNETAATKLAPTFAGTWFGKALLTKLAFRTITRDEAISLLADEAKASKEYKSQLDLLIDFLQVAGIVSVEGNMVSKVMGKREEEKPLAAVPSTPAEKPLAAPLQEVTDPAVEKFSIPLPGKPSATIIVPKGLDADDWDMLTAMMATYIERWKKELAKKKSPGGAS